MFKGYKTEKNYLIERSKINEYKQTDKDRAEKETLKQKYQHYYRTIVWPELKEASENGKFSAVIEFDDDEIRKAICLIFDAEKLTYTDVSGVEVNICKPCKYHSRLLVSWDN